MKLKLNEDGHAIVENGYVTLVDDDGSERTLYHDKLISDVKRVSDEREEAKLEAQKAKDKLKSFTSHLPSDTDPSDWIEQARKAMKTVEALDEGQLADTAKIEQIKEAEARVWEKKVEEVEKQLEVATNKYEQEIKDLKGEIIYKDKVTAFANSKFREQDLDWPTDVTMAYFGQNFEIDDDGNLFARDQKGEKIRDPANPSKAASVDDALRILVSNHPDKDRILRGSGSSGGGTPPKSSTSKAGGKTISRSEFEAKNPAERARLASEGFEIIDSEAA